MKKQKLWVGLSVFFGLILLYFSFRHVSLKDVWESLYAIKPVYFILAAMIVLLGLFLRSVRWYIILPSPRSIRIPQLFRYFLVGCMLNNTVPGRLGDITKAYIVGTRENLSKSMIFSTSIMERVFDLCSVLFLFCIASFLLPTHVSFQKSAATAFFMFGFIILFICSVYLKKEHFLKYIKFFLKFFPENVQKRGLNIFQAFLNGFEILSNKRSLLQSILLSLAIWFLACLPLFVLFKGFGISLSFTHSIFLLSVISLGIMFPFTPGNIGTMQFVCTYTLIFLGVDKHIGFLFSIMYHAIQFIPVTLIGFYFFLQMRLGLRKFKNLSHETSKNSSHY